MKILLQPRKETVQFEIIVISELSQMEYSKYTNTNERIISFGKSSHFSKCCQGIGGILRANIDLWDRKCDTRRATVVVKSCPEFVCGQKQTQGTHGPETHVLDARVSSPAYPRGAVHLLTDRIRPSNLNGMLSSNPTSADSPFKKCVWICVCALEKSNAVN